jgi:hypothetical protein
MKISKRAKYGYIAFAVFFLFYLAYAATLYLEVNSVSYAFVILTAVTCSLILTASIIDVDEALPKKPSGKMKCE